MKEWLIGALLAGAFGYHLGKGPGPGPGGTAGRRQQYDHPPPPWPSASGNLPLPLPSPSEPPRLCLLYRPLRQHLDETAVAADVADVAIGVAVAVACVP